MDSEWCLVLEFGCVRVLCGREEFPPHRIESTMPNVNSQYIHEQIVRIRQHTTTWLEDNIQIFRSEIVFDL